MRADDERLHGASNDPNELVNSRAKRTLRVGVLSLWGIVLGITWGIAIRHQSSASFVTAGGFSVLFLLVSAQAMLAHRHGTRTWQRLILRLRGREYISEVYDLPNRNYMLAELRRTMPNARAKATAFTLIQISFEDIDGVRTRRGEHFSQRATRALASTLKRVTAPSDLLAHLGADVFCALLAGSADEGWRYVRRIPGTIAVSDGRSMLDVSVAVRLVDYDLEAVYATDVLDDLSKADPLRRKPSVRHDYQPA